MQFSLKEIASVTAMNSWNPSICHIAFISVFEKLNHANIRNIE